MQTVPVNQTVDHVSQPADHQSIPGPVEVAPIAV